MKLPAQIALAVLAAFALLYLYFFPSSFDTTSHLSTVILTQRDGFAPYTTQWYAGSPMLVVYVLGFWIAHLLAYFTGPVPAYLLVEIAAVTGIAWGAWRAGKAMGLDEERRAWMLLFFVAAPMFFYSWVRVDRFPTLLGTALALFALEQAILANGGFADWRRCVKNAALLGLAGLASLHAGLIAGVASAFVLFKGTKKIGERELLAAVGAFTVFMLVEAHSLVSTLQFAPYSNPVFRFSTNNPLALLSWLGPLVCAAIAFMAAEAAAGKLRVARKTIVVALALAAFALFVATGWGAKLQQNILIIEFAAFLLAGEFASAFASQDGGRPKADFELAFAALLLGAGLTNSFFLNAQLNPVVYGFFASFFLAAWMARNWLPQKKVFVAAMVVLSIPVATVFTPDYASGSEGTRNLSPIKTYLSTQEGFGRVAFYNCPPFYYYASLDSEKPAVGGTTIYSNLDPLLREYELRKDEGTLRRLLADESYKVRWVVDCSASGLELSALGFSRGVETPQARVWEKPAGYRLVDGTDYTQNGNEIVLEDSEGIVATVSLAYYPALECEGCEFVEKGTHEMKVRLTSPLARLYVADNSLQFIGAAVLVAIAALLVAAVF